LRHTRDKKNLSPDEKNKTASDAQSTPPKPLPPRSREQSKPNSATIPDGKNQTSKTVPNLPAQYHHRKNRHPNIPTNQARNRHPATLLFVLRIIQLVQPKVATNHRRNPKEYSTAKTKENQ
jgi:hypothetical protein